MHATKLFNSGEGGLIICKNLKIHDRIEYRKLCHDGPEKFHGLGINGKNSEFHAALGLAVLPYFKKFMKKKLLSETDSLIHLRKPLN